MNRSAYNIIVESLTDFLNKMDFEPIGGGDENGGDIYKSADRVLRVVYDEQFGHFQLQLAALPDEGDDYNWETASSWLFDSSHNDRDAKSVGADFNETLMKLYGLDDGRKKSRHVDYSMPNKNASKDANSLEVFTGKFLAVFPAYKDAYKAHMEKYGEFLPDDFFSQTAAVKLIELLRDGDKPRLEKFFAIVNDMYGEGDAQLRSIINTSVLSSLAEYPEYCDEAYSYMSDLLKKYSRPVIKKLSKKNRSGR